MSLMDWCPDDFNLLHTQVIIGSAATAAGAIGIVLTACDPSAPDHDTGSRIPAVAIVFLSAMLGMALVVLLGAMWLATGLVGLMATLSMADAASFARSLPFSLRYSQRYQWMNLGIAAILPPVALVEAGFLRVLYPFVEPGSRSDAAVALLLMMTTVIGACIYCYRLSCSYASFLQKASSSAKHPGGELRALLGGS